MTPYEKAQHSQLVWVHKTYIKIIETTAHGFGTHHATTEAKYKLIHFCKIYAGRYLDGIEHYKVQHCMAANLQGANIGELKWSRTSDISLAFLIDLVTLILYAKGVDVWEVINTDNWEKNCV